MTSLNELPPLAHDENTLLNLVNAHRVMHQDEKETLKLATAAYNKVVSERAEHTARVISVYYELLAEAYRAGFSADDVTLALHGRNEGDDLLAV